MAASTSWSLAEGCWTATRWGAGSEFRIQHQQLAHHAIGPAKTVLQRVFAAASGPLRRDHVVLLHQFAAVPIDLLHGHHPAARNGGRQRALAVATQTRDCDPLQ